MTKYYLKQDELKDHEDKMRQVYKEKGYNSDEIEFKLNTHFKNYVIPLYTKKWMDDQLNYWIYIILEVPGGYWIAQEIATQPHVEFEHYRLKRSMSYEKCNVCDETAKRELSSQRYQLYKQNKDYKSKIMETTLHFTNGYTKDL